MATDAICTTMELAMKATGRTICSMAKARRCGLTMLVTLALMLKDRSMDMDAMSGWMDRSTMAIGKITR